MTSASFGGTVKTMRYDANGNADRIRGLWVSWMSYNMPYEIWDSVNGPWSRFAYGPDRTRWKHAINSPTYGVGTTYYVGDLFEREERGIAQLFRYHIFAGGKAVAFHTWKAGATTTNYLHRDHLGSVVGVSTAGASGREFYSYDAWGKRRSPYSWASSDAGNYFNSSLVSDQDGFRRGYTGHEQLDHLGLVHMNGRIYDSEIGRFLSADPNVQFAESTQGYDRYQYVNNNPLSATDPSGYFSDEFNEVLGGVVAITVGAVTGGIASGLLGPGFAAQLAGGAIGGAMAGFTVQPGGGSASTFGALGGSLSGAIGFGFDKGYFGNPSSTSSLLVKSALHGIAQGALSDASGGRFGDGFLGGSISSLAGPALAKKNFNPVVEALIAAIIGGTVSEIGGGKFVNGAMSAAFVNLFNDQSLASKQRALKLELEVLARNGTLNESQSFVDEQSAAEHVLRVLAPLSKKHGLEIGGNLFKEGGMWHYKLPTVGTPIDVSVSAGSPAYHTHPSGSLLFSNSYTHSDGGDRGFAETYGWSIYVGTITPKGSFGMAVCIPGECGTGVERYGSPGRTIR